MYVSHKIRIFSDFMLTSEKTLIIIKPQLKHRCTKGARYETYRVADLGNRHRASGLASLPRTHRGRSRTRASAGNTHSGTWAMGHRVHRERRFRLRYFTTSSCSSFSNSPAYTSSSRISRRPEEVYSTAFSKSICMPQSTSSEA